MPYNFVSEDDNKFTLNNGDQEFSIAKYDLDDGFMKKLRGLPRVGYYDGGVVAPELISQDKGSFNVATPEDGVLTAPKDFSDPATMQLYNMAAAQAERSSMAAPSDVPRALTDIIPPSSVPQPVSPMAPAVTDRPIGQPATEQGQPGYLGLTQAMQGMGGQAPFMMPEDIRSGFEKIQQGTADQAEAHAQAAMEQSRLYEEQAIDLQVMEVARKTQLNALDNETKRLQADVASNKIDPSRIYNNMTTGNRVLANISLLLGGLSQGLSGAKSNPAMDVINNAIDRDIDAQKAELGKKQNLLSLNLQKYGRLDQAFQATKMQMIAVTQAQINQQAAKMGSKQALAAAQVASGEMDIKQAMLKNQLASAFAKDQMMNKPEGLTAKDLMKLDDETQAKMVQMPNGNYMQAFNPQAAEAVRKAQAKFIPIKDLANQFYVEMEKGAVVPQGLTPDVWKSMRQQRASALEQSMTIELKNLFELGALTKDDMRLIEPLVPEIGKIVNPEAQKAAVDFIDQMVNSRLNAVYSSNVRGFNPSGRKSREISPFVRK